MKKTLWVTECEPREERVSSVNNPSRPNTFDWYLRIVFVPIDKQKCTRFIFRRRFNCATLASMYSFIDCLVDTKSSLWNVGVIQLQTIG